MTLTEIATILASKMMRPFDMVYIEMLKEELVTWRSKIIRQRLKDSPNERIHYTVSDDAVKLTKIKHLLSEYSETKVFAKPVQTPILFDYVGSYDFANPFGFIQGIRFNEDEKYTSKEPAFRWINNRIRVYNFTGEIIGVQYIPETFDDGEEFLCPMNILPDIMSAVLNNQGQPVMQPKQEIKI